MFVTGSYRELLNILEHSIEQNTDFLVFLKCGDVYGVTIHSKPFYFKTELKIGKDAILNRYDFEQLKFNVEVARSSFDDLSKRKLLTLYTGEVITITPTGVVFDVNNDYSSAFEVTSRSPNKEMVKVLKEFPGDRYSISEFTPFYITFPSMTVTPLQKGLKKVEFENDLDIMYTKEPLVIKNEGYEKLSILHVETNDIVYDFKKTFTISKKEKVEVYYEVTLNFFEELTRLIRTTQATKVAIGKEEKHLYKVELLGEKDLLLFRGTLNNPLVEKTVISKVTER